MADTVMIRVYADLRQQIKVQAAKAGLSMVDYLRKIVNADASKLDS